MGGWSGGVYTRFRNWVTDKANSVNPQASLFDQEDDGFAAGLNNCVTKDGTNKPAAAMDWNGQDLTGVRILTANNVTVNGSSASGNGLYLPAANTLGLCTASVQRATINATGEWVINASSAATTFTVNGLANFNAAVVTGAATSGQSFGLLVRGGTTSADRAMLVQNQSGSASYFQVRGDGVVQATDDNATLQTVGWRDAPQTVMSGPLTLALQHRGCSIFNSSGTNTLTIPANASVAFPVGTTIMGFNGSGANLTLAITTDTLLQAVTGSTGSRTVANLGFFTLYKYGTTSWVVSGNGVT